MGSIKSIEKLAYPWQSQDPFIFCAFHLDHYPRGNGKLGPHTPLSGRKLGSDFSGKDGWSMYHGKSVPGFPAHPHKGFETITIAEKGLVDHSDSLGAAGRFGNGDVQWMTAGGGVQHSEMFPLLNEDEPNPLLLFQIWLNLPRASKNVPAHFAMLWNEDIPREITIDSHGRKSSVKVVCGSFGNSHLPSPAPNSFAAISENHVAVWLIEMEPFAELILPIADSSANRSLYAYQGDLVYLDDREFGSGLLAQLNASEATVIKNGHQTARFLILQGKPIGEPVAQYGPFVMNTQEEIRETMMDYQQTQFGGWPWPDQAHTHDPQSGRFAIHANGKKEIP